MDVGHTLYLQSVLQGAVQKAGRDATLDNGGLVATQTTIDDKVKASVAQLIPNADVAITRRYYKSFTTAAAAIKESFTDTNGDGTCNAGEPYQDSNNNNVWDADGGNGGQGGAKDNVVYTVTVTYPHMFPVTKLIGMSENVKLTATTVLANQPYGDQTQYSAAVARNCT